MPKLTKRLVDDSSPGEGRFYVWDTELRGFGLLVLPSGTKTFVFQYRNAAGRSRRLTIGRYGALTVDEARDLAKRSAYQKDAGSDPVADRRNYKAAPTMSDLLNRYISDHLEQRCSEATRRDVVALVEKHIRPRLGTIKVNDLTRADIAKLHNAMKATPRRANYAIACLSKALALAEEWGLRPEHSNPCGKISRFEQEHRTRFLSGEEIERLGQVLAEAETLGLPWRTTKENAPTGKHLAKDEKRRTKLSWQCIGATRLLLLTGARLSEITGLKWADVDTMTGTLALPERKGGKRKPHPVSNAAMDVLGALPRVKGCALVFPRNADPKRPISTEAMESAWQRIRWCAGIEDVHLHDLRHTIGTYAAQAGVSSFIVRDLLRHRNITTTARYANFDADPVRGVANAVSEKMQALLVIKKS
ncbi:MAG: tyrosine-type recombinase/integrase [Beijerinckiaceae bacterium]|jgi:integrase|nr:tyrosine-type recombinase/integrase [Beijerinckiaceae bacterium]